MEECITVHLIVPPGVHPEPRTSKWLGPRRASAPTACSSSKRRTRTGHVLLQKVNPLVDSLIVIHGHAAWQNYNTMDLWWFMMIYVWWWTCTARKHHKKPTVIISELGALPTGLFCHLFPELVRSGPKSSTPRYHVAWTVSFLCPWDTKLCR